MSIGRYADLTNKVILVTGGSSGIGAAIAKALDDQGAKVILSGRTKSKLAVAGSLLKKAQLIPADLLDREEMSDLIDSLPQLDGICHCAGIASPFPVAFVDEIRTREVMEVNFHAPSLLTSSLFQKKKINSGAALLYISSVAASLPYNGGAMYSASKAAIEAYCRSVAVEQARKKVRANAICAGMVKTNMYFETEKASGASMDSHIARYPLGLGEVEDIASAALFLLSDASSWITGASIVVDGGFSLGQA